MLMQGSGDMDRRQFVAGTYCTRAERCHNVLKGLLVLADEGAELAVVVEECLILCGHGGVHAFKLGVIDI